MLHFIILRRYSHVCNQTSNHHPPYLPQTVKAFLPIMVEHNSGHIVTIASMAGHVGVAKLVDYCSSKAAACGFDEALRLELEVRGATGVHTSLICPYFIRSTGMFDQVNSR